ncbi:phage holin family protein [Paenibacillus sinopodophylli]|uniref:phage holin family protein n=1 Tax=Paenibacillus sinopodophylli TaxID=1837342 RepID=UPI00110C92A8|nr:phage holin family protein [Paenibacillus sinopodophylli]
MYKQWLAVDITEGRVIATGIGAVIAPWVTMIYGDGRLIPIILMLVVIGLDWITGIEAARKDKTYSSQYGIREGLPRTLFLVAMPAIANLLDTMMGMPGLFFYGITLGIIYHTWQSLTANAYRAGWGKWIPKAVMSHIESELKAKVDRASKRGAEGDEKNG